MLKRDAISRNISTRRVGGELRVDAHVTARSLPTGATVYGVDLGEVLRQHEGAASITSVRLTLTQEIKDLTGATFIAADVRSLPPGVRVSVSTRVRGTVRGGTVVGLGL